MERQENLWDMLCMRHEPLGPGQRRRRIDSYDTLRGLAVVFMILIHVMHFYGTPDFQNGAAGLLIEFLGGPPAAPVFMMLMGAVFVYTPRDSLKKGLLRGINLLLVGYALNLVRGIIPYFIYGTVLGSPQGPLSEYYQLEFLIFEVDILVFAGAAYIAMALLYRASKRPMVWLLTAAAAAALSPLLWGIGLDVPILKYPLSVLWGEHILTTFPVFPWIVFPLCGMVIGHFLCAAEDEKRLFGRLALWGIPLALVGGALMAVDIDVFYHEYNQMGVGAVLAMTGFVLMWQWLIDKADRFFRVRTGFLRFLSQNVLAVYCIHWTLIKWAWPFVPLKHYGLPGFLVLSVCFTAAACVLTKGYVYLQRSSERP